MADLSQQTSADEPRVAYQTARTTAKVAGTFAIVFLALFVSNFIGTSVIAPLRENRLVEMKAELRGGDPTEEQLADIRQLDLQIRRNRMWRLDFAHKSGYALLVSVVLFLVAGKLARVLNEPPPRPRSIPDVGAEQIREARGSRWTVVAGLVTLGGVAALLITSAAPLAFVEAKETGPSYASMEEKRLQWHRFRGPDGGGVSVFTNIPTEWDGATGKGILWKTAVPLPGNNSPVIWNDRIFLCGATEQKQEVYCYDANAGRLLWTGDVPVSPAATQARIDPMEDTGRSASTMATDGKRVYAIFVTGDIAAFDFHGRRLWHKSLGVPESAYGYASSLETYQDRVIVQYDQGDGSEDLSRLYALDGTSGRIVWEVKREVPNSWTSPIVVEIEGRPQLITLTDPWALANDPADGAEIWRADCLGGDVAPSPIYAGGLVLAIEPYSHLVAIRPTGQGDVTETHIAWTMDEGGPDICCPVADGQHVYLLESHGLILCCRLADGEKVYEQDLCDNFTASPSLAAGRLYFLSMDGVMTIAEAGPEYKELGKSELGEKCHASPAFGNGRLYIRGLENLYCIGEPVAGGRAD
mgnify:FL=1